MPALRNSQSGIKRGQRLSWLIRKGCEVLDATHRRALTEVVRVNLALTMRPMFLNTELRLLKPELDALKLQLELLKPELDLHKLQLGLLKLLLDFLKLQLELHKSKLDLHKLQPEFLKSELDFLNLQLGLHNIELDNLVMQLDVFVPPGR